MIEIEGDGSLSRLTPDLLARYGVKPTGVIHVGAHKGEEVPIYRACGFGLVVLVEPERELAAGLRARFGDDPDVRVHARAVGDVPAVSLRVWYRDGRSVGGGLARRDRKRGDARVLVVPLRQLQAELGELANVLVVDTQGTELDVLRSADLGALDLVVVETDDTGGDASRHGEVVAFMAAAGWRAVERWRHGRHPYADVLFVRDAVELISSPMGDEINPADLVVVVPTFGRPASAARLVDAFQRTCTGRTDLLFVLQANDPRWQEYDQAPRRDSLSPCRVSWLLAPAGVGGTGFVAPTNWATALVLAREDPPFAIGFMGDDHQPVTVGWDTAYVDTLRELGTGYVYGDDLIQGPNCPTQVAMTANIPRAFGYLANPIQGHLFADNMWLDLGQAAGCIRYMPGVVVEHLHMDVGKAPRDATYMIGNSDRRWTDDPARYKAWRNGPEFNTDVATLRGLLP